MFRIFLFVIFLFLGLAGGVFLRGSLRRPALRVPDALGMEGVEEKAAPGIRCGMVFSRADALGGGIFADVVLRAAGI